MSLLLLRLPLSQQPLLLCPWQPVHASACLSLSAPQALLLLLLRHHQPLPQQLQQQLLPPPQLLHPSPVAYVVAAPWWLLPAAGRAYVWLLSPQALHLQKPETLLLCYQHPPCWLGQGQSLMRPPLLPSQLLLLLLLTRVQTHWQHLCVKPHWLLLQLLLLLLLRFWSCLSCLAHVPLNAGRARHHRCCNCPSQ
jgi:hypothetical protein